MKGPGSFVPIFIITICCLEISCQEDQKKSISHSPMAGPLVKTFTCTAGPECCEFNVDDEIDCAYQAEGSPDDENVVREIMHCGVYDGFDQTARCTRTLDTNATECECRLTLVVYTCAGNSDCCQFTPFDIDNEEAQIGCSVSGESLPEDPNVAYETMECGVHDGFDQTVHCTTFLDADETECRCKLTLAPFQW